MRNPSTSRLSGLHPSLEGRGQVAMNLGVGGPKKDEKGQYTYRKKIINELITFYRVLLRSLGPKGCSGDGE